MTLPSTNVRDYPNMTKAANEMFAYINEHSPYGDRGTHNLIVVQSYYIDGPYFTAEYRYGGTVRSMSIEFGSRGRSTGLPDRYDPPASSILEWIEKKGIKSRYRKSKVTGRFIRNYSLKQLAYAIAHTVGQRGTKEKGWGRELAEKTFKEWEWQFSDAFAKDIDYQIEKYYPELLK